MPAQAEIFEQARQIESENGKKEKKKKERKKRKKRKKERGKPKDSQAGGWVRVELVHLVPLECFNELKRAVRQQASSQIPFFSNPNIHRRSKRFTS